VQRYGWRAYALPILSVVTVAALVQHDPGSAAAKRSPWAAGGHKVAPTAPLRLDVAKDLPSTSSTRAAGVQVEGLTAGEAGFDAGSTPAPVVINLGDDGVSCATNTYRRLVLVSISRQHLWACQGGRQVSDAPVTTGATIDNDQTPLGSWRVQAKQRDRYLVGPGYKDYVHYWVPFNGDFGLHDAPWQTMAFGSKSWPTQGSHGCVHVPTATMTWIYRWAAVGSTVVTIES
jgi:lipoprotein-anchoring transpeptidase ErfK/SrfK